MGSLLVEFSLEEKPRIISWFFLIRDYQEYVPRTSLTGIVVSPPSLVPPSFTNPFDWFYYTLTDSGVGVHSIILAVCRPVLLVLVTCLTGCV